MFGLHLVAFWLCLVAYCVEAGFQLAGITPRSPFRSALFAGLMLHALFLSLRRAIAGRAPMAGLFESLTVLSFCSALSAFLLCRTQDTQAAWKPLSLHVAIPQAGAALVDKRLAPLYPALERLDVVMAPEGYPRDVSAVVTVFRGTRPVARGVLRENDPLFHDGYGIYIKNFGAAPWGTPYAVFDANRDPGAGPMLVSSVLFTAANLLYLLPARREVA